MEATYKLKPIVATRLIAEVSALGLLSLYPLFLLLTGNFGHAGLFSKALSLTVSAVSGFILPAYGFVVYKVRTDRDSLHVISVFKQQRVRFADMQTLRLKTNFGWRRYAVQLEDGSEINFPVWLQNINALVEAIRDRLPERGSTLAFDPTKVFEQAASATVIQFTKASAMLIFIVLCWMFLADMQLRSADITDASDRWFMFGACVVMTLFLLARTGFLLMMPRKVEITDAGLDLVGHFYFKQLEWSQVEALNPPFFLLPFMPEGLLLRTDEGIYLLGDQLDFFDELEGELKKHVAPNVVHHQLPSKNR